MHADIFFWNALTQLLQTAQIVVDRPKGSSHPRCPDLIYPFDYGYVENTAAADGGGIDVWLGSLSSAKGDGGQALTGILCTFDTLKRDAEIKLLVGCNREDIQRIQSFNKDLPTIYIPNPAVSDP